MGMNLEIVVILCKGWNLAKMLSVSPRYVLLYQIRTQVLLVENKINERTMRLFHK